MVSSPTKSLWSLYYVYIYIYIYMYIYVPLYIYISFRAIPAYNIKSIKSGEIAKKLIKTTSNTHTPKKNKNDWGLQRGEKHKGNAAMIQSKLEHLVEHFWLGQIFVGILISNMSLIFFVYVPICVFFFGGGGNWYCGLLKMSKYSECDFMRFLRRCDVGFDVSQFLKSSLIFRKLMGFDGGGWHFHRDWIRIWWGLTKQEFNQQEWWHSAM